MIENDSDNDLHLMKDIIEVDNKRFKRVIVNDSDYNGDGDGDGDDDGRMMFSTNHTIKYDYPLDTTIPTGNTTGTTLTFMKKLCQQYSPSNIELKSSSLRIMNHA